MNPALLDEHDRTFRMHIMHYITMRGPAIQTEDRKILGDGIYNFVHDMIAKFERGQREHGGHLITKDVSREIYMEILDLVVYNIYERKQAELARDRLADQQLLKTQLDIKRALEANKDTQTKE